MSFYLVTKVQKLRDVTFYYHELSFNSQLNIPILFLCGQS